MFVICYEVDPVLDQLRLLLPDLLTSRKVLHRGLCQRPQGDMPHHRQDDGLRILHRLGCLPHPVGYRPRRLPADRRLCQHHCPHLL